jgi:hypothetical protein
VRNGQSQPRACCAVEQGIDAGHIEMNPHRCAHQVMASALSPDT